MPSSASTQLNSTSTQTKAEVSLNSTWSSHTPTPRLSTKFHYFFLTLPFSQITHISTDSLSQYWMFLPQKKDLKMLEQDQICWDMRLSISLEGSIWIQILKVWKVLDQLLAKVLFVTHLPPGTCFKTQCLEWEKVQNCCINFYNYFYFRI